jgi:predicted deacetylase
MSTSQYLLRFDDICPTMNWRVWEEIEAMLVERRLKPVLAVVPDNRDPDLQVDSPMAGFWDRVREWQDRGWTIAMHGFQHFYVSRKRGMAAARKRSEFAGLPADAQREKLRSGMDIFKREGITSHVWIAPSDTFDATTVALLPEVGINVISAGCFQWPYTTTSLRTADCGSRNGETPGLHNDGAVTSIRNPQSPFRTPIVWVPLQMHYFRPAPPGVWTVCTHHNLWNDSRVRQFREDLDRYGNNIRSLDDVLQEVAPQPSKWSEWLCTHPRLSEFLIRGELKMWAMTMGRIAKFQPQAGPARSGAHL